LFILSKLFFFEEAKLILSKLINHDHESQVLINVEGTKNHNLIHRHKFKYYISHKTTKQGLAQYANLACQVINLENIEY
jgi:hypothetical protein